LCANQILAKRHTHIPIAAHNVVNVLAVLGRIRSCAGFETDLIVRYERVPFMILEIAAERVAINQTADYKKISF
jgi:hypothetical protein